MPETLERLSAPPLTETFRQSLRDVLVAHPTEDCFHGIDQGWFYSGLTRAEVAQVVEAGVAPSAWLTSSYAQARKVVYLPTLQGR